MTRPLFLRGKKSPSTRASHTNHYILRSISRIPFIEYLGEMLKNQKACFTPVNTVVLEFIFIEIWLVLIQLYLLLMQVYIIFNHVPWCLLFDRGESCKISVDSILRYHPKQISFVVVLQKPIADLDEILFTRLTKKGIEFSPVPCLICWRQWRLISITNASLAQIGLSISEATGCPS
jgi:hypothetical protein